jgi:hypothetical protein
MCIVDASYAMADVVVRTRRDGDEIEIGAQPLAA